MYIFTILILCVFVLFSPLCKATKEGGAIPTETNRSLLRLNIVNIDWNDRHLATGDRRIKNTGFVLSNWAKTADNIALHFGIVGVLLSDSLNENKLEGALEENLRQNFDLANIFIKIINEKASLSSDAASVHLNADFTENVLELEPWCFIFAHKKELSFVPQLNASLRDGSGKVIWRGSYGPETQHKPLEIDGALSKEDVSALQNRLKGGFSEIADVLLANVRGQNGYVSQQDNDELTERFLNNIQIENGIIRN